MDSTSEREPALCGAPHPDVADVTCQERTIGHGAQHDAKRDGCRFTWHVAVVEGAVPLPAAIALHDAAACVVFEVKGERRVAIFLSVDSATDWADMLPSTVRCVVFAGGWI